MKNTTVEDLFKAMDKAIILSKTISDMTDKEQKTFNYKLQELGLIKRVNIFTDDYITTMKDNRETCDEEKIDVSKILDNTVKVYMNDELIWYLQDFKISNNKIEMSEACTVEGLDKIIKNYNKIVNITFKCGKDEIMLIGKITSYELV